MAGDRKNVENSGLPTRVARALEMLQRRGVWHVVSRNTPATSCRDAASRRQRLGNIGIPLYDELKTLCVAAYMPDGERRHVLLHCRSNVRYDLKAARNLIGATRHLARLGNNELEKLFQTHYGTVNPFSEPEKFIQVFDKGILDHYTPPHSMMTNAGEMTWAVEFRPAELIEALRQESPKVFVGSIVERSNQPSHLPAFGIITGNGPDSGIALWQQLNTSIHDSLSQANRMRGDLSYPRVVIESIPEMGLSMELREREEEVWSVIKTAVELLIQARVDYIAIACNTTQIFAERIRALCDPHGIEFVAVADVVAEHIRRLNISKSTLIGIPVVAEMGEQSAFRSLRDLGVNPVDPVALPHLQELGYMVKRLENHAQDNKALNKLQHIMRSGVATEWVIVALTEISILLTRFPRLRDRIGDKRVLDTLRIYGEALAQKYLNALPQEREDETDQWQ